MKAIIFDCFGVLYLNSTLHFYETHIADYGKLRPELLQLNKEADYGLITEAEQSRAVADLTGLSLAFISQHIRGVHTPNRELIDFSQSLRPKYKVGMLSNIGLDVMNGYFSVEERKKLFDATVLSAEVGIAKPHPYIYEIIASRLGVAAGECVMIDDIEDNCAGADAAGMKTIHYQDNTQTKQELKKLLLSSD